jgi:uncharacterized protein YdeI (YjbR/CyaY-like superfamily)
LDAETFDPGGPRAWHDWLLKNHQAKQGVWLVFHRKGSGIPTVTYDEALDEALAFGWIDSVIKKVDETSYVRKFTPRRPYSIWSSSNIARVGSLKREGRMTRWGLEAFAKRTSEVSVLEKVNARGAVVPKDFEAALRRDRKAWANFQAMAPSHRKRYIVWLAGAKRPETRKKRIAEAVVLVGRNVKNLLK